MGRMERPSSRHSFGCPDDHWQAIEEIASERGISKSKLIRELVAQKVDEHRDDGPQSTHDPTEERHRTVYHAALEASNSRLRLRAHDLSTVAQDTQLGVDTIEAALHDLRRTGHASLMGHPPDVEDPRDTWRIKPPEVDPDDWTYNEANQWEPDRDTLFGTSPRECLSHDWSRDGTCFKCNADRDAVEDVSECDTCEFVAPSDEIDDGECETCQMLATDGGGR
jgi:hypothetical protein